MPVVNSKFLFGAVGLGAAVILSSAALRRYRKSKGSQRTFLCTTINEWDQVSVEFLKACISSGLIGLDCEWVSEKGKRSKISTLQLAPSEGLCCVLRLSKIGFIPPQLVDILNDPCIFKVGVAVLDDARKLTQDYNVNVRGCIDLRYMITSTPAYRHIGDLSLAAISKRLVGFELDKSLKLRCCNWDADNLTPAEVAYAANDAFAAFRCAQKVLISCTSWFTWSSSQQICSAYYGIFVDIPFRKAAKATLSTVKKKNSPPKKMSRIRDSSRKGPLYSNSVLQAPDGEVLCTTDEVKMRWYLKMELGTLISEEPFVVRLNFEPRCRAILGGEYYVEEKQNICVVCGKNEDLVRKNVVPQEYRKLFPSLMKQHSSHDIVLMCVPCHHICSIHDTSLRTTLDQECEADEVDMVNFANLKRAAKALYKSNNKLPAERRVEFENILGDYFETELTDEMIKEMALFDVKKWKASNNRTHARRVIKRYSEGEGLFELEVRWRTHFLKTMEPRFLADKWSVYHNHDTVLMKIATGRNPDGHQVPELLKILGVSWKRMKDLIDILLEDRIETEDTIKIWTKMPKEELVENGVCEQ